MQVAFEQPVQAPKLQVAFIVRGHNTVLLERQEHLLYICIAALVMSTGTSANP